ncbi:MAG TPA: glycosyltransferase family 4 protein [Terriglobales bacterium]|nr:glycosyltransferase family 4 protein [Terriglobales bacterium]
MKILWVKAGKLLPLDTGGKLRTYNILRHLAATHELTYLSYYGGDHDPAFEKEIAQELPGAVTVHTGLREDTPWQRYMDYAKRLLWSAPYAVSKFTDPRVQHLLSRWLPERRFEVAVCDFLSASLNFPRVLSTPSVLFQHNVESILWQRKAQFEPNFVERTISKFEYGKMSRYEPVQVRRFHHVIAVSEADREGMSGMVDSSRISVVPTGVDLSKFRYDPGARPAGPIVVFTGSMDWEPNIDGVEYFCKEIWPQVLARVPGARFQIVGRNPHPRVQKLASASVEVTGTVASVVDYLRNAAVFVIPLRIGGGTRIKIYEGMAMGKATVSTTIGAEGLGVQHERDILLADDAHHFAAAVVNLLTNEEMRQRYEAGAAATAQKYDWSVITREFVQVLERAIRAASPAYEARTPAAARA